MWGEEGKATPHEHVGGGSGSGGTVTPPKEFSIGSNLSVRREDYFDAEETSRLNVFRRSLYASGMSGAVVGAVLSTAAVTLLKVLPMKELQRYKSKNLMTAALLVGPAFGAFIGSTVYGQNELYSIQDIFDRKALDANPLPTEPGGELEGRGKARPYIRQMQANLVAKHGDREAAFERRQAVLQQRRQEQEECERLEREKRW